MNLAPKIARRYLFSRKSTNVINVISIISMTGMMFGAIAMILVLSVFNGFGDLVASLYNTFYSDVTITAIQGKTFEPDQEKLKSIEMLEGVEAVSMVVEESAIIEFHDRFHTITLKGVDENFSKVSAIDSNIVYGKFVLQDQGYPYAVLGAGVDLAINMNLNDPMARMKVYLIKRGIKPSLNPNDAFEEKPIAASGIFETQQDFDNQYVIVPLTFMQDMTKDTSHFSAIEISLTNPSHAHRVQSEIEKIMGDDFKVQDKFQQNDFIYKVHRAEKWAAHAILSFILIIASFNIIGALSMLVIEKKKDISILKTMGATDALIKRIFLLEGLFQAVVSCSLGCLIAASLVIIQQQFHLIPLRGTFAVDSFPVSLNWKDFVLVFCTISLIALAASWIPASRAAKMNVSLNQK